MDNKGKDLSFGKRIAQLRRACNLTQEELAEEMYIARSTLSNFETDRRQPDVKILQKLSRRFNVPLNYLINHVEDEENDLMKSELDARKYLTNGMLDLSSAPAIVKVMIVELYLFLLHKYKK